MKWKKHIYVIQVYFLTSNRSDKEIDGMYSKLEELLNLTEEKSNVIIQGDFNSSVEQASISTQLEKYGLRNQNYQCALLVNFCVQMGMVITRAVNLMH